MMKLRIGMFNETLFFPAHVRNGLSDTRNQMQQLFLNLHPRPTAKHPTNTRQMNRVMSRNHLKKSLTRLQHAYKALILCRHQLKDLALE